MKRKLFASAASALATLVAMPAQAATADCWSADEVAAVRTHHLAMLMMVDALKCRTTIPATQEAYDRFADQKRALMQKNRNIVEAHFVRTLGATEGLRAADTYDTGVSNRTSDRAITPERCEAVGALARTATLAPDADLPGLAATVADVASFDTCPVAVTTLPATMNTPAWPLDRPPPGALTMPAAETPGQLNERGVLVRAVEPAPAPAVTAAAAPPPTAADGTAAALREAAASLAQAAAALSAATAARDPSK